MIVSLIDDNPLQPWGEWEQIGKAIAAFCAALRERHQGEQVDAKWIRMDLWAGGLAAALTELEQSAVLAHRFAEGLAYRYEEDMPEEDRLNYYRHLYFYKDAFIRLFSVLDKTGHFLDMLFELHTAKVKSRFSYYTVLREMHKRKVHAGLEQQLYERKQHFREPMSRLRRRRNLEIHAMNMELIDDVWQKRHQFADRREIEPIGELLDDLDQGLEMVRQSMLIIFQYCTKAVG